LIISADWGTSSFRLRLIDGAAVVAQATAGPGIAATYADWQCSGLPETERIGFYRDRLERAIGEMGRELRGVPGPDPRSGPSHDLRGVPVIVSGMASSSIGMLELPYKPLPFDATGADLQPAVLPATEAAPRTLYLIPGVRWADDVMRGEETQLIGSLVARPGEGVFLFPGTHSKHILVRDGKAIAFKTYMTGEVFGLLSRHSILAASVAAPDPAAADPAVTPTDPATAPGDAFYAGVAEAARGSSLLHNAFLTRTNQLFNKYSKEDNYHFLSGLLIGDELRELAAPATVAAGPASAGDAAKEPLPVTLVASSPLQEAYTAALAYLGFRQVAVIDADEALIAGHCVLFAQFGATIA
jgi:2-dehydro-3-deoxygalactonokinase